MNVEGSKYLPKVLSKVVKIVYLYSSKFNDDFTEFIAPFFQVIS